MLDIRSTLKVAPIRAVIFGKDGLGKSTFCAAAPRPVFIAAEDGLDNIDTRSVPPPGSWASVLSSVDALAMEPSCDTIVIDSLDWAEQLCWSHVCVEAKEKTIESFGYGKGYVAALGEWRVLLAGLARARAAGKHILLTAHADRRSVKNPTGEDYDCWVMKMNSKAAGLVREWVDVVGFAELDVSVMKVDGLEKRSRGMSSGRRVLRTQPAAGYDSKTRFNLPRTLPLEWESFANAVRAGAYQTVPELSAVFEAKLLELGCAEVEFGARAFIASNGGTAATLKEAIATVQNYIDEKE